MQHDLEELLASLRFPVVTLDASPGETPRTASGFAGLADYVLQVVTRTSFSSADGAGGPYWYRTTVVVHRLIGRW